MRVYTLYYKIDYVIN